MMLLDIATSKKTISNCTDRLVPGRTRTCLGNQERQGVPGLTCANQLDRWSRDGMGDCILAHAQIRSEATGEAVWELI